MKNNILKILIIMLCFLFLNFPISYSITNINSIFLFLEVVVLIVWLCVKKKKKTNKEKNYFIIVIILSIITRIGIVLLLNSSITQYSDFEIALNTAYSGDISDGYHLIFSHWNLYPLILHVFCKIFGNYQIIVLLFNGIINVFTCIMIYLISNKIFTDKKYGFIASIIYIIWPANILYTLILTQEHIGILLILIVVYIFLNTQKYVKEKYLYALGYYILLGLVIGFSIFFKNFSYVLFIAFVLYHLGYFISQKISFKEVQKMIPLYLVMILVYFGIQSLTYSLMDHIAGKEVSRNLLPYTLNIGLRGDGHWNREYAYEYRDLAAANNYDFDKTNDTIMSNLMKHIKQSDSEIRKYSFWNNKAKVIFNEDDGRMLFIKKSVDEKSLIYKVLDKVITPVNNRFISIIGFLMIISTIWVICSKDLKVILIMLIIHGSGLILLLIESQNRYKYPLLPFMCIIASIGLVKIVHIIKNILIKRGKLDFNKFLD